jgi:hypothetical protein
VSEFFEPPPPPSEPPEREEHRRLPWFGPPDNELGVAVAIQLELVRAETLALAVLDLVVFSSGCTFDVAIRRRRRRPERGNPYDSLHDHGEWRPDALHFGLQFADGAKAISGRTAWERRPDDTPTVPLLMPHGGGGGARSWNMNMWLWPLPPPGPLAFVCEWQAEGVALTRREIDAQVILDAAGRSEVLWPDESAGGA